MLDRETTPIYGKVQFASLANPFCYSPFTEVIVIFDPLSCPNVLVQLHYQVPVCPHVIAGLPNDHNFKVKVIGLKILKEYQSHCLLLQVTKTNRYIYILTKKMTPHKKEKHNQH